MPKSTNDIPDRLVIAIEAHDLDLKRLAAVLKEQFGATSVKLIGTDAVTERAVLTTLQEAPDPTAGVRIGELSAALGLSDDPGRVVKALTALRARRAVWKTQAGGWAVIDRRGAPAKSPAPEADDEAVERLLDRPITSSEIAAELGVNPDLARRALARLQTRNRATRVYDPAQRVMVWERPAKSTPTQAPSTDDGRVLGSLPEAALASFPAIAEVTDLSTDAVGRLIGSLARSGLVAAVRSPNGPHAILLPKGESDRRRRDGHPAAGGSDPVAVFGMQIVLRIEIMAVLGSASASEIENRLPEDSDLLDPDSFAQLMTETGLIEAVPSPPGTGPKDFRLSPGGEALARTLALTRPQPDTEELERRAADRATARRRERAKKR